MLRHGLALTAVGTSAPFAGLSLNRDLAEAVEHILDAFGSLQLHPDVAPGSRSAVTSEFAW